MASKKFTGFLRTSLGSYASHDLWRFTHISTTGEVVAGSAEEFKVEYDGFYDIEIEYGNVVIESKNSLTRKWFVHGSTVINSDTTATTLPALLNATVPVSDTVLLQMQTLLQDAQDSASSAQQSANEAAAVVPNLQSQIDTLDGEVVKTSGDQTVSGVKTFNQDIIATSIRSTLGVDQGLLFFSLGSTRIGGTGSAAGIQLRPNGRDVSSDTDYFSFQPSGTIEYEGASNFSVSRAGGQHGVFAYADGRTFLTGVDGNIELRPKGLADASKGLSMSSTGTTIHSHSGGAFLSFRDEVNDGTNSSSYMQWMHLDNTRRGFLGYGTSANNNMTWFNDEGANNIALKDNGEIDVNTGSVDRINLSGRVYGGRFLSDSAIGGSWGHSDSAAVVLNGTNSGLVYNLVKVGAGGAKIQALGEGGSTLRVYPEGGSTNYASFIPTGLSLYNNGSNTITMSSDVGRISASGQPTSNSFLTRKDYVDGVASDERLKSNIKTVEDALSIVSQIPVKTYFKEVQEWDEETQEDKVVHRFEYGFIAQEVEEVLPHLVTEREQDGMKEILRTGNDFHAIAFKAIQELSEENKQLKDRLAAIEAHLGLGE